MFQRTFTRSDTSRLANTHAWLPIGQFEYPFIQTTAHCASLSVTYPCRFLNYTSQDLQLNCSGIASRILYVVASLFVCFTIRSDLIKYNALLYLYIGTDLSQAAPLHRVLLRACPEIAAWRHDFGSFIHRLDSEL